MANQGRRATLKDVAEMAGTSVATASRVLTGHGAVAEEKRARILEAATALSYQPNLQARALRQQASHGIGLVIPNLLNAYYTALADAISQILASRGYHLLLAPTRDNAETEAAALRDMIGQNVDGLILVPSTQDGGLADFLREQGVPSVVVVRRLPHEGLDTVTFEDYSGAYAATQHLLSLGHRRIGYIGGDTHYSSNQARWQGYQAALRDAGLEDEPELSRLGSLRSTWGAVATADLLRLPVPPTAIFAASNALVPGLIRTLQSYRVAVPAELSLICFDDVDWFSFTVPPITAVNNSHGRLADAAVTLLLTRIEKPEQRYRPPVFMEISYELVLRSSTAAPRRGELVLHNAWNRGRAEATAAEAAAVRQVPSTGETNDRS
jgi:LacI family transcriptional regulator